MKRTRFACRFPGFSTRANALLTRVPICLITVLIPVILPAQTTLTTLHNFTGGSDGAYPDGNVTVDPSTGAIYGTTLSGGSSSKGTIYKLTPPAGGVGDWSESVLYTFTGGADGGAPGAGLVFDNAGALYGTTLESNNSPNGGVAFKLAPGPNGSWSYSVLYTFTGGADGNRPNCNPLFDNSGNLYGTTGRGGASGDGVIFKLTPPKSGVGAWTESVLHTLNGTTDGSRPLAGLIADATGSLYGTATEGGAAQAGTVFKLTPPAAAGGKWAFETIHNFSGGTDGINPIGGLLLTASGDLLGTTWRGGLNDGVVFQMTPPKGGGTHWSESVIYTFSGPDGANPTASLIYDQANNVYYGTTMGFLVGYGNVFKLTPPADGGAWSESVLTSFVSGTGDGQTPISSLIQYEGALYSITYYGGPDNLGTVFELN